MAMCVHEEDNSAGLGTDALFAQVYERLKAMAGRQLGAGRNTLDATALVHELYLRIGGDPGLVFAHPDQFFAYAAQAMRHLLTDRARVPQERAWRRQCRRRRWRMSAPFGVARIIGARKRAGVLLYRRRKSRCACGKG